MPKTEPMAGSEPLLSLCMIVRDNASILPACLEGIEPWVDEMIVVDTGSKDETPAIAKRMGARVFEFPWCDDFSAARNQSIEHARGQWLFWMDSDDTIDEANGQKLRQLAYSEHRSHTLGYTAKVICPGGKGLGAAEATEVDHVKLFRAHPELRFEFRIHEQLLPGIRRLGGDVLQTDIFVVHSGADNSPEGRRRKQERDLRILNLEIKERPDHPFALFNFGMTYSDMGEHEKAADHLRRSLEKSSPQESQVKKTYALLVNSYDQLGRTEDAWTVCKEGRTLFPNDPELLFREGKLAHDLGRLEDAKHAYQTVLNGGPDDQFSSIDCGIVGYKARHNLALVYADMDRPSLAELQWRRILEEEPRYRPGWLSLGKMLVQQNRLTTAEVEIERMNEEESLGCEVLLLQAALAEARNDYEEAETLLRDAVRKYPEELEPRETLCKLQFDHCDPAETAKTLREMLERDPKNAAAHHNLGALYFQIGDRSSAVQSLKQSLELRPDSENTRQMCASALESLGRIEEAVALLRGEDATCSQDPSIETTTIGFDHGLSDCAQFARIAAVYAAHDQPLSVVCRDEHKWLFQAVGAEAVDQCEHNHRWSDPPDELQPDHVAPWQGNKPFWNVSRSPLPSIGTKEDLWTEFCSTTQPITSHVSASVVKSVDDWISDLPRPVVLLQTTTDTDRNGLGRCLAEAFCGELLIRTEGSLVVLDTDPAIPQQDAWRIRCAEDYQGERSAEWLVSLIDQVNLVIGADSAALHFANLVGKPTVGIWPAERHPARFSVPVPNQLNIVLAEPTKALNR